MKAAEFNELRFMSRKKFMISMAQRDMLNKDFIRHPDELEEIPPGLTLQREKPLRGYLERKDYETLKNTKDFLYGEWDLDRLERDVRIGVKRDAPAYVGQFNPGKKALDDLFKQCREYQSEIAKVKRDVTYTEMQKKALEEVDQHLIREANDWVLFEEEGDQEVANVTSSAKKPLTKAEQELKKSIYLKRSGIIIREF